MTTTVSSSYAADKVVLIAAKGSGIESISNRDIRRIFLGLKATDSKQVNKPVLNLHNKAVYEEFLKNIMHMTEGTYKRKIVKRIFRNGTEEIKEVEMLNELNAHLTSNVGDISFVEYAAIEKMHDIEVVKILW
jgi:ABC-type phosphate transport system substrate-binding protein